MTKPQAFTLSVDGERYAIIVEDLAATPVKVSVNGRAFQVEVFPEDVASAHLAPAPDAPPASAGAPSEVVAPMPGDIVDVRVKPNGRVSRGDVLCHLEAMKMNNAIHAPRTGVIAEVRVRTGQAVKYGEVLVTYGPD